MTDNHEEIEIRYTEPGDAIYLKEWLLDKSASRWFPMCDEAEVNDAVNRWVGFYRYKCSLTAVCKGIPCGIATLYLQPYRKLAHQCEFGIIIGTNYRNRGVGTELLNNLMFLAKETFHIKLLHLQVCATNPAIRLYERFGFKEFGRQNQWIQEEDGYVGRVFMERFLT